MPAHEFLGRQFWAHEPFMPTHEGEVTTEGMISPFALRPTHKIDEGHSMQDRLTDEIEKQGINRPIEVSHRGKGRYFIENGHHRVAAAQALGHDLVPVRVYHKENDELPGLERKWIVKPSNG